MDANSSEPVDLLVVGGGINGTGIARDAAGRGLKVLLCEQDDLASHTSSASSKLIHGGLRYLEQYEFRLVREALVEREVLLRAAPHIIWPLRFVLPHDRGAAPGLADPPRPVPLRPAGRPPGSCRARGALDLATRPGRAAAQAGVHARLRLFRLLGRRRAAGRRSTRSTPPSAARRS